MTESHKKQRFIYLLECWVPNKKGVFEPLLTAHASRQKARYQYGSYLRDNPFFEHNPPTYLKVPYVSYYRDL